MDSCPELPLGIGLIVCDTVIDDKLTGKKSLIGIFGRVNAEQIPCVCNSMSVLVSLTGGIGTYDCQLICQHEDSQTNIVTLPCKVTFKSPKQIIDLVFILEKISFPQLGEYWFKFVIDDVPVMMRPLTVRLKTPRKNTPPPPQAPQTKLPPDPPPHP